VGVNSRSIFRDDHYGHQQRRPGRLEAAQDLACVGGLPPLSQPVFLPKPDARRRISANADISSPGSLRTWTAAASTPRNEGIDQKRIETSSAAPAFPATESPPREGRRIAPLDHHGNDSDPMPRVADGTGDTPNSMQEDDADHT